MDEIIYKKNDNSFVLLIKIILFLTFTVMPFILIFNLSISLLWVIPFSGFLLFFLSRNLIQIIYIETSNNKEIEFTFLFLGYFEQRNRYNIKSINYSYKTEVIGKGNIGRVLRLFADEKEIFNSKFFPNKLYEEECSRVITKLSDLGIISV